ncbi:glycosyl hydrolase [Agromyces bauzanensis]|uniref:glucan endo-1,3-beta-D-glucosidase n=1 Tax=Agromyces bauzanensis TaxID=1308924 RepID=A0A917PUG0_9MICO|nr:glycosyl hydrolase [Agromyces bauzanensis]GGJ92459.1 hypothetical protein GCM10011372_33700 [Agromyces bauzanensis]
MRTRIRRATVAAAIAAGLAVVLSGCLASSPGDAPDAAATRPAIAALPEREVAPPTPMRLADGLVPPTNRWFSGLVFGDAPQPVFPFPLGFALTDAGFAFGLARVDATATTIFGGMNAAVTVDAAAVDAIVSGYDAVSVTITLFDGAGAEVGTVSIAEGRPDVTFTATATVALRSAEVFTESGGGADAAWHAEVAGTEYGLIAPAGAIGGDGRTVHLAVGETAQWFATPEGTEVTTFADAVGVPGERVDVVHAADGDSVTTRLDYGGTAVVAPAGVTMSTSCELGSFDTVYGPAAVCAGGVLEWEVPRVEASAALDLDGIDDTTRQRIAAAAAADLAATPPPPADTYFGGKWMYRLANLALVARAVGSHDVAAGAGRRLVDELRLWTDPKGCEERDHRCFVYDPVLRGVVGLTTSFGSEEFNDHHFHYGYLIHAAAVAAMLDPSLADEIAPVVDAVVADIASPLADDLFPERRLFDPYTGHSWASGFAPFADGNNQESSSEAAMAWNAVAIWSAVRGSDELAAEAAWMLSAESHAARARWLEPDLSGFDGFAHEITSINWGGKRDYATWFSAEPNAMLGIQLIPMGPVSLTMGGDADRIRSAVGEATPNGFDVQFGDYLLMYRALAGRADASAAAEVAATLPDSTIDDANSRAYLLAWFAAVTKE